MEIFFFFPKKIKKKKNLNNYVGFDSFMKYLYTSMNNNGDIGLCTPPPMPPPPHLAYLHINQWLHVFTTRVADNFGKRAAYATLNWEMHKSHLSQETCKWEIAHISTLFLATALHTLQGILPTQQTILEYRVGFEMSSLPMTLFWKQKVLYLCPEANGRPTFMMWDQVPNQNSECTRKHTYIFGFYNKANLC